MFSALWQTLCVIELLKAGAQLNVKESSGNTALMWAVQIQHVDCVKELIAAGADVNVENKRRCPL